MHGDRALLGGDGGGGGGDGAGGGAGGGGKEAGSRQGRGAEKSGALATEDEWGPGLQRGSKAATTAPAMVSGLVGWISVFFICYFKTQPPYPRGGTKKKTGPFGFILLGFLAPLHAEASVITPWPAEASDNNDQIPPRPANWGELTRETSKGRKQQQRKKRKEP